MTLLETKYILTRTCIGKFSIYDVKKQKHINSITLYVKDKSEFMKNGYYEKIKILINDPRIDILIKENQPNKLKHVDWWDSQR